MFAPASLNAADISPQEFYYMATITRLYDNHADAAHVVAELEAAGVPHSDISLVSNNAEGRYGDAAS